MTKTENGKSAKGFTQHKKLLKIRTSNLEDEQLSHQVFGESKSNLNSTNNEYNISGGE